jgi:hypothetical protein
LTADDADEDENKKGIEIGESGSLGGLGSGTDNPTNS